MRTTLLLIAAILATPNLHAQAKKGQTPLDAICVVGVNHEGSVLYSGPDGFDHRVVCVDRGLAQTVAWAEKHIHLPDDLNLIKMKEQALFRHQFGMGGACDEEKKPSTW